LAPIIALHGGPGLPSNYLLPLADAIPHRSIILYDQLGCGQSDSPENIIMPHSTGGGSQQEKVDDSSLLNPSSSSSSSAIYSIQRSVLDLHQLIQHLGLHKFHLYGHSYGGMLAYEYIKWIAEIALLDDSFDDDDHKIDHYHHHHHKKSHDKRNSNITCLSVVLSSTPSNIEQMERNSELLQNRLKEEQITIPKTSSTLQLTPEELFQKIHFCRTQTIPRALMDAYAGLSKTWFGTSVIMDYIATPPIHNGDKSKQIPHILLPPVMAMVGEHDFVTTEYGIDAWKKIWIGSCTNQNKDTLNEEEDQEQQEQDDNATNKSTHGNNSSSVIISRNGSFRSRVLSGCSHMGLLEDGSIYGNVLEQFFKEFDEIES